MSRNFELVGRVNLDQLEQMKGKTESSSSDEDEKEEEMSPKTEQRGQYRFLVADVQRTNTSSCPQRAASTFFFIKAASALLV